MNENLSFSRYIPFWFMYFAIGVIFLFGNQMPFIKDMVSHFIESEGSSIDTSSTEYLVVTMGFGAILTPLGSYHSQITFNSSKRFFYKGIYFLFFLPVSRKAIPYADIRTIKMKYESDREKGSYVLYLFTEDRDTIFLFSDKNRERVADLGQSLARETGKRLGS